MLTTPGIALECGQAQARCGYLGTVRWKGWVASWGASSDVYQASDPDLIDPERLLVNTAIL
jgi:hypothetical protein